MKIAFHYQRKKYRKKVEEKRLKLCIPDFYKEVIRQGKNKSVAVVYYNFVSRKEIRRINKEFLNHDYVTDVISFELGEDRTEKEAEIYVCLKRVKKSAAKYKTTMSEETARVMIHGLLHLIGYDDGTKKERKEMRRAEAMFIERMGNCSTWNNNGL